MNHHHASDCRTEQGISCVFPFTYRGVTYKTCTTAESDNNKAWCATQVDSEGVVVNNKWQDCAEVRELLISTELLCHNKTCLLPEVSTG